MNHITVRWLIILNIRVFQLSANALLDNVAGLRGTVVVEVIIAVYHILLLQVFREFAVQRQLLGSCQVQHLLSNHAAEVLVLFHEYMKGIGTQLVVGETEHETGCKVGSLEVEDTPVKGYICASGM